MEVGTIRQINIDNEMQASYLDYAMSVIVSRALPDVRDGLKPVHRRILYAMHDLGLTSDKPYKKSARIVGEVLGKYHPHGDAAVYEAMVRMAQDFSLRYPLVDGQGNFGSIDGDNAAAMRYTEARLAPIANEMLADIDKETVDWNDNFDGTLKEPSVLPAALPNLVVNGSAGIAVGMATNIPPHNLGEVCDALCYVIDNYSKAEDISTEDLMRFIQGPDFPTGGVVFRYAHEGTGDEAEKIDAIERAYGGGKGAIVMQAKAHIEEMSRNRNRIVVTELPYQTDKSRLLERIAELVREGRIEGITDLRDESDRTGMRICIEMTRTVDARKILADLYKYTPLQSTFGVSLLALVDGEPRLLSLKRLLLYFLEHRQRVILRRSRFELARAKARAHILEGLLRALDVLDEIIALIRASRTADIAKQGLKSQFAFTEVQAQAILDMQLRRLAALERQRLQDEYKQVQKLIKELEELLASPKKVLALIKKNLVDLKATYGDARRTQIADRAKAVLTAREHAIERDVWVTLDADGRLAVRSRGDSSSALPLAPAPLLMIAANTRQDLYLFTASGRAVRVEGHRWPDTPGAPVADIAGIKESVVAMLALECRDAGEPVEGYLALGTAQGKVKRAALADLFAQAHTGPQVINVEEGDALVWAAASAGEGEMMLFTAQGQAIRFGEEEVRPMGLPAGGVSGIKLRSGDRVAAGLVIGKLGSGKLGSGKVVENGSQPGGTNSQSTNLPIYQPAMPPKTIAIVTAGGFAKQVPLADFPTQGRYGSGVVAARVSERTGQVIGAAAFGPNRNLACVLPGPAIRLLGPRDLPTAGRDGLGRPALKGERVERIYSVEGGGAGTPEPSGKSGAPDGSAGAGKRPTRRPSAGPAANGHGGGQGAGDGARPSAASRAAALRAARKGDAAEPSAGPTPNDRSATAGNAPMPGAGSESTMPAPAASTKSVGKAAAAESAASPAPAAPSEQAPTGRKAAAAPAKAAGKAAATKAAKPRAAAARSEQEPTVEPLITAAGPASATPGKAAGKGGSGKAAKSSSTAAHSEQALPAGRKAGDAAHAPGAEAAAAGKAGSGKAVKASAAAPPEQAAATGRKPAAAAAPQKAPGAGRKAGAPASSTTSPAGKTGKSSAAKAAKPPATRAAPEQAPAAARKAAAPGSSPARKASAGKSSAPAATFDRSELLRAAGLVQQEPPAQPARGKARAASQTAGGQLPLEGLEEKPARTRRAAPPSAAHEQPPAAGAGRAPSAPEPGRAAPPPADAPQAPAPRPKRSAADGPMTWPVVKPRRDDEDEVPPPRRRR